MQELEVFWNLHASTNPTIIEDNVLCWSNRSEVVEGVIVGEGSVLSMGMYLLVNQLRLLIPKNR